MKNLLLVISIVFGVALIAAAFYCFILAKDRNSLKTELTSITNTLASTQSELSSTKNNLEKANTQILSLQSELNDTNQTLSTTQTDLNTTKQALDSTQGELETTKKDLVSTQSKLGFADVKILSLQQDSRDLQNSLSKTQDKLNNAQDTLEGLGITLYASADCSDVQLIDNPDAKNPTTSQLINFLRQDQTETHVYIEDKYDCSHFSRDVHNNAEAAGIRTAEVQIHFKGEYVGHALNAFLTTDCGLVYVDCTGEPDKIARIKVDKEYRAVEINMIPWIDIRNDVWWDNLTQCFHILKNKLFTRWDTSSRYSETSDIRIYW
jgi:DNA gyrase/topoisomerase IV subunit A